MTLFKDDEIRKAFDTYRQCYLPKWPLCHKGEMYQLAERAFQPVFNKEAGEAFLHKLRAWQVFRGASTGEPPVDIQCIHGILAHAERFRSSRSIDQEAYNGVEELCGEVATIKKLRSGGFPVMAVSKVLHFWNPRFFVIVDGEVMQDHVLSKEDIRQPLKFDLRKVSTASEYVRFLRCCSDLLRENPGIMSHFAKLIGRCDCRWDDYKGTAVECFLEGLAGPTKSMCRDQGVP